MPFFRLRLEETVPDKDLPENDYRRNHLRFYNGNFGKNPELVEKVREVAYERYITLSQLAIAWLLHQDEEMPDPVFAGAR